MLFARLKDIGMPPDTAWNLTAQIRDRLHPVAAVAAAKILKAMGDKTGGLGAVSTGTAIQAGSAAAGAAAGAAWGSVVPGIGTAVGAVVGLVASMLIHQGQGALRLAQAQQIDNALATLPSAFVGRTIPWLGTAQAPGLLQFISAIMTGGLWMSWDPSVVSHPGVNGNWSTTFMNAVKAVTNAIINNPPGAQVSVPISFQPGTGSIPTQNFVFTNPGINAGPDAIAASVIMGPAGLMYWMVKGVGESDAHAAANATGGAAQKVFALMIDHATADAIPSSLSATLANAPIVQVPPAISQIATPIAGQVLLGNQIPALTSGQQVANVTTPSTVNTVYTDNTGNPITAPAPLYQTMPATIAMTPNQSVAAGLMQNMLGAQGANFVSPQATQVLADVAANGVEATPYGPPVIGSLPSWAPWAGIGILAFILLRKRRA